MTWEVSAPWSSTHTQHTSTHYTISLEKTNKRTEIPAAPFREKPVLGQGEPAAIVSPWTRKERGHLTKDSLTLSGTLVGSQRNPI